MLNRRQQWRRSRASAAVRRIPDAKSAQELRRASIATTESSRGQGIGASESQRRRRATAPNQAAPFRSLFPGLNSRTKPRVSWNTTVRFRQIPHVSDLEEELKLSVWWTPEDFRSFARAELFRLMHSKNMCGSPQWDEDITSSMFVPAPCEASAPSPAVTAEHGQAASYFSEQVEEKSQGGLLEPRPMTPGAAYESGESTGGNGTSEGDEEAGLGLTALCSSPEVPGKWDVMLFQQSQSVEGLSLGRDDVFVVESAGTEFCATNYISCAT